MNMEMFYYFIVSVLTIAVAIAMFVYLRPSDSSNGHPSGTQPVRLICSVDSCRFNTGRYCRNDAPNITLEDPAGFRCETYEKRV